DPARGEYRTVGGFVMHRLGRVPAVGDAFGWQGARFEVGDMDGRRVDKGVVAPAAPGPREPGPGGRAPPGGRRPRAGRRPAGARGRRGAGRPGAGGTGSGRAFAPARSGVPPRVSVRSPAWADWRPGFPSPGATVAGGNPVSTAVAAGTSAASPTAAPASRPQT